MTITNTTHFPANIDAASLAAFLAELRRWGFAYAVAQTTDFTDVTFWKETTR